MHLDNLLHVHRDQRLGEGPKRGGLYHAGQRAILHVLQDDVLRGRGCTCRATHVGQPASCTRAWRGSPHKPQPPLQDLLPISRAYQVRLAAVRAQVLDHIGVVERLEQLHLLDDALRMAGFGGRKRALGGRGVGGAGAGPRGLN